MRSSGTPKLRTIRLKRVVPPADKITQGQINALAKAAAKRNVRVLLSNGLRISPDGTVDRPEMTSGSEEKPPTSSEPEMPASD